ncbi:MAG: hypothetical protein TREMPRED_002295 [Tremellales sp. Tagirdzhanova-0007]|nr:MAG: hypothetical protein TREMPRED_002295 [Tremellales sp. Tagirdzhanova-0007]
MGICLFSFYVIVHPTTEVGLMGGRLQRALDGLGDWNSPATLRISLRDSRLVTYYMINYYIKYVELIDTIFLVLKKKPLGELGFSAVYSTMSLNNPIPVRPSYTLDTSTAFLHVFHHAATAVLCFTQLEGTTSVQWVVITLNLLVHVLMYYYYYATAGGAKLWWKKYLTSLQISQFVIDLFVTYFASTCYNHFATAYTSLPVAGDCAGSESAALLGCGLLTFYLFLFIGFYRATYKKTGNATRSAKMVAKKVGQDRAATNANGSAKIHVAKGSEI